MYMLLKNIKTAKPGHRSLFAFLLSGLFMSPVFLMTSVQADQSQWYFGGNAGISQLEPDPNGSIYTLVDNQDVGYKLYAGYDITSRWTVEGFWADLGMATLNPSSSIVYKMKGIGINYYFSASRPGLSGLVKIGVGQIENIGNQINFRRVEDTQIYLGGGLEYQLNNGLSLRGEYEYHDEDAQFLSIGLAWRFGGKQKPEPEIIFEANDPGVPEIVVVEYKQEIVNDPVISDIHTKPVTNENSSIKKAKPDFISVLEGVTFLTGSAQLAAEATSVLKGVAEQLIKHKDQKAFLVGHTDNHGTAKANWRLSFARARSVAIFLTNNGVAINRVKFKGKGESEPRASNATANGRALNRRVELRLQN